MFEIETSFDFTKNWMAFLEYRLRKLTYLSNNVLDIEHYGQDETRHKIGAGIGWKFMDNWSTRIEYRRTHD